MIILYVWFMYSYLMWPFQKQLPEIPSASFNWHSLSHWVLYHRLLRAIQRQVKSSHVAVPLEWGFKHAQNIKMASYRSLKKLFPASSVSFLQLMQWSEPSPASRAVPTAPAIFAKSFEWMGLRVEQHVETQPCSFPSWKKTVKENIQKICENPKNMINKKNMYDNIIYHNSWTSGPNGSMTLKESKNINSHKHRIYLRWSLSFHARDAMFFQTWRKTPKPWDSHLFTKELLMLRIFGADWAIKCAVCKELLQFNLGRFSIERLLLTFLQLLVNLPCHVPWVCGWIFRD